MNEALAGFVTRDISGWFPRWTHDVDRWVPILCLAMMLMAWSARAPAMFDTTLPTLPERPALTSITSWPADPMAGACLWLTC